MKKLNCIFLIDDDVTTNFLSERLIKKMNITDQVMVAKNGKEGLDLVGRYLGEQEKLPGLILLDINMPVMDGFEFLEAYQKLPQENKNSVQIVMLTTSSNQVDIQKVKDLGVSDYLTKPLRAEMLQEIINKS